MDPPAVDEGGKQQTLDAVMEDGLQFHCDYCDLDIVHTIAQILLVGLATACVDNTTGDFFKSPSVVAVDMRKEMVDYLTQRSETFVADFVIQEDDPNTETSDHPTDIIENFIEDFTSLKRNLLSRVSGWLLSEKREDNIDDFVQEMEINGFWLIDRREVIAATLLKNIDFKSAFHCEIKFDTVQEFTEHKSQCNFRIMDCTSEGCNARFCAVHTEKHDSMCSYKVLPCEQECSEMLMRHEMDRHCITVCSMKLVNCPFYQVGCSSTIPACTVKEHCSESLCSHVLSVLRLIHRAASEDDLEQRLRLLDKLPTFNKLSEALGVRTLIFAIKAEEANLKMLEGDSQKSM